VDAFLITEVLARLHTVRPSKGTIFHYTSQEGLLGIIREKALWMSSIHHLNDATEFTYAVNLVRTKLQSKQRTLFGMADLKNLNQLYSRAIEKLDVMDWNAPPVFVGSFSEEDDQLSQWRAYTGDRPGFSIGFEYDYLKELARMQSLRLVRCAYTASEHGEILDEIIEKTRTVENLLALLAFVAPTLKDPSFREEKEYRIHTQAVAKSSEVGFRSGRSMLVPYRPFSLAGTDGKMKITRIVVGPTPHMDLSISSVKQLLAASDVEDGCDVADSKIPYRNW
jgi:hypothetical protein